MGRTYSTNEMKRKTHRVWVGELKGKRPLGRPRHKWKDDIKMDLRGIEWGFIDWFHMARETDKWRASVNTVMNIRVP
jgi:hypothetical protein